MFKNIKKAFSKNDAAKEQDRQAAKVALDALCAHRDKLIMQDDFYTAEVSIQLYHLHDEIQRVVDRIHQ